MAKTIVICVLSAALLASVIVNICLVLRSESYLQEAEQIYIMEAGIIERNLEFAEGEHHEFDYDFDNSEYAALKKDYDLEKISGNGSEFEKGLRLMDEFAPRLTHRGDYPSRLDDSAQSLLKYSLNNKKQGINCRAKAQILNEMCLALGIYSRKVWLMPYARRDPDCHVVNEIWDTELNKWVMLDITNNEYWADENGTPLSVLEIRRKGAKSEFCTPVKPSDKLTDLKKLKQKHMSDFIYIMKNVVYLQYLDEYGVGETLPVWELLPKGFAAAEHAVSESAITASPVK